MYPSILAFWIGLVVFLPGMVKKSVHHYGQSIGHHISYESIDVSPWNLKVDIVVTQQLFIRFITLTLHLNILIYRCHRLRIRNLTYLVAKVLHEHLSNLVKVFYFMVKVSAHPCLVVV